MKDRPDLDMDLLSSSAAAAATAPQIGSKRGTDNKFRSKLPAQAQDSTVAGSSGSGRVSSNRSSATATSTGAATSTSAATATSASTGTSAAAGNFVTQGVIDATIQCMVAQAAECESNGLPAYQTERMVMEEMGRCLVEIVDSSLRQSDTPSSSRQE